MSEAADLAWAAWLGYYNRLGIHFIVIYDIVFPYHVLSYLILSYIILSCFFLFCLTLCYPIYHILVYRACCIYVCHVMHVVSWLLF